MPNSDNIENRLLYQWLNNLVGSYTAFSLNLGATVVLGLLYSFNIIPSPYLLLIFGVISPIIFTLCMYFLIRNGTGELLNEPLPKVFVSRAGNRILMIFDICLIIGFSVLIYLGPLNFFLFRFLQTVFFPGMLLLLLRLIYVGIII
jgi:hypothetical protein